MLESVLMLTARIAIAAPFAFSAIPKLMGDRDEEAAIAGLGLPAPRILELACGVCLAAGAAALVSGVFIRPAAALLAAFVAVVTPVFMPFWKKDGGERRMAAQGFVTNFGLAAGLVYVAVCGPGQFALDPSIAGFMFRR